MVSSGVMGTHDQETLAYFKGTGVTCVLCPRQGSEEDSYLQVRVNIQPRRHGALTALACSRCAACSKITSSCVLLTPFKAMTATRW